MYDGIAFVHPMIATASTRSLHGGSRKTQLYSSYLLMIFCVQPAPSWPDHSKTLKVVPAETLAELALGLQGLLVLLLAKGCELN